MLNVEDVVKENLPRLHRKPWLAKPTTWLLRNLLHENDIRDFSQRYPDLQGIDFVEQVLDYFNFDYQYRSNELDNIPTHGRLVIVANHPIGSLDGLALLKLVSEVRSDVKIVANDLLLKLKPLQSMLLPVTVFDGQSSRQNIRAIHQHLHSEGVVIIFPAGEVSRLSPQGIRDSYWQGGFLKIAQRTQSPVLPIRLTAHNSALFYTASMVYKPLATLLLVKEMFRQQRKHVCCRIGEIIPNQALQKVQGLASKQQLKLLRKHLYRVGTSKELIFPTQTAIARPEARQALKQAIEQCQHLGSTACGKQIYCYQFNGSSPILREIGRLREVAFRSVGEGTWQRRDIDDHDLIYMHLILWDPNDLEIAGAYRLGDCAEIIQKVGPRGLYTENFYQFDRAMSDIHAQGLELGRSFVQPRYWGKRSLDFLWSGIGALLNSRPQYRYLFGSVSISGALPEPAKEALVAFYRFYFPAKTQLATAYTPYNPEAKHFQVTGCYNQDFTDLKSYLASMGCNIPTLYKQYTDLCEAGGVQFLEFGVDPDFCNAIDGLVLVDITQLKPKKRQRYFSTLSAD